jgi:hypothetical protein
MGNNLLDPETGEQHTHALIHTIKTINDANLVLSLFGHTIAV